MDAKTTLDRFVIEFAEFEGQDLGFALRSLMNDESLVDRAEAVLDLRARLTLLKRVAYVRRVKFDFAGQLDHISRRACRLGEARDQLIAAVSSHATSASRHQGHPHADPRLSASFRQSRIGAMPTIGELDEYRREIFEFRSTLRLLVEIAEDERNQTSH